MVSWLILIPKACIICEEDLPKRKALRVRQSLFIIHISKYCILFFKVIIHDPGSIPMTSGGGAVLQPGTNTNLILSRWEMIRQPAPYTSNCTQNWGPEFTFFAGNRSYDSKLCQSFCFSKVLIDLCGCELVKMMEIFPGKINLYLNSPIFRSLFVSFQMRVSSVIIVTCWMKKPYTACIHFWRVMTLSISWGTVYVPHNAIRLIIRQKGNLGKR